MQPSDGAKAAQFDRTRCKTSRNTPTQLRVVNNVAPPPEAPSRWLVRWANAAGSYEGHLRLNGNSGSMRVTWREPGTGTTVTIDEAMFVRQEGDDVVLQGVAPVIAGTDVPATSYQADHAHVRLGADGLVYAAFCDVMPAHQCFPASLIALPASPAPASRGGAVSEAAM